MNHARTATPDDLDVRQDGIDGNVALTFRGEPVAFFSNAFAAFRMKKRIEREWGLSNLNQRSA